MAETAIEWTDKVWNPVTGCTIAGQGCQHCYAKRWAARMWGDRPFSDVRYHPARLLAPLSWRQPQTVFITSMGDLWHQGVPEQVQVDVLGVVVLAHWITFIDLTKRSARRRRFFESGDHGIIAQFSALERFGGIADKRVFRALNRKRRDQVALTWPPPNYIAGSSVSTRADLDAQIPDLLATPVPVRLLSAEPLLEDITADELFSASLCSGYEEPPHDDIMNGVIVGGESGPDARPMHPDWPRRLRDTCQAAGVAFFFKQWGEWREPSEAADAALDRRQFRPDQVCWARPDGTIAPIGEGRRDAGSVLLARVGKQRAGRLLDGREWNELPEGSSK